MRARLIAITLITLILLGQLIFAQQRGGGLRVVKTNSDGSKQEVQLYDGSYALIIGNSEYLLGWNRLSGVRRDVVAVRNVLEKHGFKVEIEENLTSELFERRIRKFINDYGYDRNNRMIIYYAGHGYTLNSAGDERELGYIIPSDTPLPTRDERGFRQKAISMYAIQTFAKEIQAKHALFVFDSCFSGKLFALRDTLKIPPFIVEKVNYPVRQFITAGDETQAVPDESIFRKVFVRGLEGDADRNNDGYITGAELADYLKEAVTNYTNRRQTPQYGIINDIDLDRGDFVFVLPQKYSSTRILPKNGEVITNRPGMESNRYVKLIPYRKGDKWGFSDSNKNIMISPRYDEVLLFKENLAGVKLNGKWGFINRNGSEVIPIKYNYIRSFSEGLAAVEVNGKWGFIDVTAKLVLPAIYELAWEFEEGYARVMLKGPFDIDKNGNTYPPIQSSKQKKGLTCVVLLGTSKYTFIDQTGKHITPTYDMCDQFSEGLAPVCLNGKCGFIDESGKVVIPFVYQNSYFMDPPSSFSEGLAAVRSNNKYGFIDKSGKVLIPIIYEQAGAFYEGLAPVKLNGKWGFIDRTGKAAIEFQYDRAMRFSEGLSTVIVNGKLGFINKSGKFVITPKYTPPTDFDLEHLPVKSAFNDGLALVEYNGKIFYIGRDGTEYYEQ